jgi:hypothetical protein
MTIQVYYEIIAQEKEEVSKGITKVDDPARCNLSVICLFQLAIVR